MDDVMIRLEAMRLAQFTVQSGDVESLLANAETIYKFLTSQFNVNNS